MKKFNSDLDVNPSFNTVTGLSNTTFSPTTTVENRMATEAQIQELYRDIIAAEQRRDYCCRDIIVWETHTQIVRMNTNTLNADGKLTAGGVVASSFDDNVSVGTMRRGLDYTVTFPIKWDSQLYVPRSVFADNQTNCSNYIVSGSNVDYFILNYRIVETNSLQVSECDATTTTVARFWYGSGQNLTTSNTNAMGHKINPGNNWGNFFYNVASDGTVTIRDNRRNTNFNIIRYYTQWILRECADGSTIPDPT